MDSNSKNEAKILGFSIGEMDRHLSGYQHSYKRFRGLDKYDEMDDLGIRQHTLVKHDIMICCEFLLAAHWKFDLVHISQEPPSFWLDQGVALSLEYFYGDYLTNFRSHQKIKKSEKNSHLRWLEVYRFGLLFSLLSQDTESMTKLAEWVEPWLCDNETSFLLSPADNSYHKYLANHLTGRAKGNEDLRASIEKSKKRRPKLLLLCLDAIENKDSAEFKVALKKHLAHFLRYDFEAEDIRMRFSFEGSILWHVAALADITIDGLSSSEMALIMTQESLSMKQGKTGPQKR